MKRKIAAALATILLTMTSASFAAGTCNGCTISSIGAGPYYDGICTTGACVFIKMSGTVTGRPACQQNASWDFILDTSTAAGRSTYALLLAAKAAGSSVNMVGSSASNPCSLSAAYTENLTAIIIL